VRSLQTPRTVFSRLDSNTQQKKATALMESFSFVPWDAKSHFFKQRSSSKLTRRTESSPPASMMKRIMRCLHITRSGLLWKDWLESLAQRSSVYSSAGSLSCGAYTNFSCSMSGRAQKSNCAFFSSTIFAVATFTSFGLPFLSTRSSLGSNPPLPQSAHSGVSLQ